MNKKGLIGKIFLIIGIIILIMGIIIGVSAYQGYRVYQVVVKEQAVMEENAKGLQEDMKSNNMDGLCTKTTAMENSINQIKGEIKNACANPLIKSAVAKIMKSKQINLPSGTIVPDCNNIGAVYDEALKNMKPLKDVCNNQTLLNQIKQAQLNMTNKTN